MARQLIVVALVFVAIVGLASAQKPNPPQTQPPAAAPAANDPKAKPSAAGPSGAPGSAPAPADGPAAQPGEMPDVAKPGPVGSPGKADAPNGNGATALRASAVVAAGVAVAGLFY